MLSYLDKKKEEKKDVFILEIQNLNRYQRLLPLNI